MVVSEKHDKLCRWKEYYSDLLNRPPASPSDELVGAAVEAVPDPTIDCSPPAEEEVMMAVSHLKKGKAPGCVICRLKYSSTQDRTESSGLHPSFSQFGSLGLSSKTGAKV